MRRRGHSSDTDRRTGLKRPTKLRQHRQGREIRSKQPVQERERGELSGENRGRRGPVRRKGKKRRVVGCRRSPTSQFQRDGRTRVGERRREPRTVRGKYNQWDMSKSTNKTSPTKSSMKCESIYIFAEGDVKGKHIRAGRLAQKKGRDIRFESKRTRQATETAKMKDARNTEE